MLSLPNENYGQYIDGMKDSQWRCISVIRTDSFRLTTKTSWVLDTQDQ